LLKHRIRLDFGARRTLSPSRFRLFQLFTNGQRQFAQKVDIGNDPKAIFCSFRLRNPDVKDDRPEIESNLPTHQGGAARGRQPVGTAAARMRVRFPAGAARWMYRLVQTLTARVPHSSHFEPGRTIPDLSLRFTFSNVQRAFNTLRFIDGPWPRFLTIPCKRPRLLYQPGPFISTRSALYAVPQCAPDAAAPPPPLAGFVSQISGMITMKIIDDSQKISFSPSIAACAFNERSKNATA